MTTKKANTKKAATRRPSIKERAQAIIADVQGYDVDTRNAVARALRDNSDDLTELVRQAEAGAMILDLAGVEEMQAEAARLIFQAIEHDGTPDFLRSAMLTALDLAGLHVGLPSWKDGPEGDFDSGGVSPSRLARLFGLTTTYQLELVPKPGLAEHLSAVLRDESTPKKISDGILDGMTQYNEDVTDPAYIKLILAAAEEKEVSAA